MKEVLRHILGLIFSLKIENEVFQALKKKIASRS